MRTNRRQFLTQTLGSSALLSLSPAIPHFLSQSAFAAGTKGDNVLVIVQLTGGNDGLNTIAPYADDVYRRNRVTLGLGAGQVLKIDDYVGFHNQMTGMSKLLEDGKLAILQGIGYPNPDRSHFESMDIWHSAQRDPGLKTDGWLGRYLDEHASRDGGDVPGMRLGAGPRPLALRAHQVQAPSIQSPEQIKLETGGDTGVRSVIEQAAGAQRDGGNDLLGFVQKSTVAALASSERVRTALSGYNTPINYPGTTLARRLRTVAQLIDAGLNTRIYYVELDGFDTHSDQSGAHAALLSELSGAVAAFIGDLAHHGHDQRVMLLAFSEFGRRVKENASQGTDHGAAAPMFAAGGRVRPGLIGKHPSLTDLDDGDLKFHTDFRQMYATVLDQWLGGDSTQVLGQKFDHVPLVKA